MAYNNLIGRTDAAGLIPVEYSNELLENVQTQASVVMTLARQLRRMQAYEQILPVVSAQATASFRSKDTGLIETTEINWTNRTIYAEEIDAIVVVPKTVLSDANIPIWDQVRPDLEEAIGLTVDNAVLYGTGAPSTFPTAIITAAAAASHGVTIGTGVDLYADMLVNDGTNAGCFPQVWEDGFAVTGAIADLSMMGRLNGVRDANGQPIFATITDDTYRLANVRTVFPMNGSGSSTYPLIVGDWRHLAYSVREGISYEVSTDATIYDASGNPVHMLFQQSLAAIKVSFSVGFAISNNANRVNSNNTTRYPFSYLYSA